MKRPRDTNQLAKRVVDIAVGDVKDEPQEPMGKQLSGLASAAALTPEQRRRRAAKASAARWSRVRANGAQGAGA